MKPRPHSGFSLIELLVVLALIGSIAAAILPNLGLTYSSAMATALRDFSAQVRAVFDSAVLTGRLHRLVLNMETGEYWAEAAPLGYTGRPPAARDPDDVSAFEEGDRERLLEELDEASAEPRSADDDGTRTYAFRSLIINQRSALRPTNWSEVSDSVLYRRSLPGDVRVASLVTEQMVEKRLRSEFGEDEYGYIYFLPDGILSQATIHFGIGESGGAILEEGPKFTIFLDPLTGRSQLLEGFQDAEFIDK